MTIAKLINRAAYEFKALPEGVRAFCVAVITFSAYTFKDFDRVDDVGQYVRAGGAAVALYAVTWIIGKVTPNP